jgi:hypothetical protein
MSQKLTEEKRQRLIDRVIDQIKYDISIGDVRAVDELLHFVPNQNLIGFLSDDENKLYYEFEDEIKKFKEDWGQSHSEITANLNYPRSHSEADELLTDNYFWIESDKKWYNRSASGFTEKEQEIAQYLFDNFSR